MAEQDPTQLLREGIEAAREGDKKKARELFEKVVELEENNEKAWFWLASVMESDEERRICLTNVLHINPDNERAKKELEKIEARAKKTKADEEVVPGVTRGQLTLYVGGAAVVIIVIVAIVLLLVLSNNARRQAEIDAATALVQAGIDAQSTSNAASTFAAETQIALASPTPTITPTRDIPPTWTPTSGPTAIVTPTPLSAPVGLPGFLVGWNGTDVTGRGFLSAALYPLDGGGTYTTIGDREVRNVVVSPSDGTRVVYTRYISTTSNYGLEIINRNGTQGEQLSAYWAGSTEQFLEDEMPSFSRDGTRIAFVARTVVENTRQLFILDLTAERGAGALTRLTQDPADYSYPAISPDGTRIAVVRNDANSLNPGEDIIVLDIATRTPVAQVTSNGSSYVESALNWQNDNCVGYAFAPASTPDSHDIGITCLDALDEISLPGRDPVADDLFPVFSPDGTYMAFASNRGGQYDIYILNLSTNELFQLTNSEEDDFPGGWYGGG
jgi:hypothetical protein